MRLPLGDSIMAIYTLVSATVGVETLGDTVRSTFLFALPTWQEGVGRLVDFGNWLTDYNRTPVPEDPDARATAQDWLAVGDDLRWALWSYGGGPGTSR
jgi:hypothetical protein